MLRVHKREVVVVAGQTDEAYEDDDDDEAQHKQHWLQVELCKKQVAPDALPVVPAPSPAMATCMLVEAEEAEAAAVSAEKIAVRRAALGKRALEYHTMAKVQANMDD